jgi:hypothetical protein
MPTSVPWSPYTCAPPLTPPPRRTPRRGARAVAVLTLRVRATVAAYRVSADIHGNLHLLHLILKMGPLICDLEVISSHFMAIQTSPRRSRQRDQRQRHVRVGNLHLWSVEVGREEEDELGYVDENKDD